MTPTVKFEKGNETKGVFSRFFDLIKPQKSLLGNISFGEVLTFNALLVYLLNPIENIINLQPALQLKGFQKY